MKKLVFLLSLTTLLACDRPNPHPEQLDPVYADLAKKAEEVKKAAEAAKAATLDAQKEVDAAKPQTGQILYARKRLYEAMDNQQKLEERARYSQIKAELRMRDDQKNYQEAWSKKQAWPDPAEYQQFLENQKIAVAKKNWDIHGRLKEAGHSDSKGAKKEGEKEAKKKE